MENVTEIIQQLISNSGEVKVKMAQDKELHDTIGKAVGDIVSSFNQGGKVLLCGNGGSAADAQHIAAELSGRFYLDRDPLFAEALHVNSSYLTAVANDYSFDSVFSRLIKAKGKGGDVLIAISTSGNSENIVQAIDEANEIGLTTIGLTGSEGGKMKGLCKYLINVPSSDTPRIQEGHILIGHIICELVEKSIFDQ